MPVLLQEGRLLHARRACSQIQKGPFFCLNTHALHSCGAKQIYIKIKYSSHSHAFHSPTHFPSSPNPHPSHPHSTHLPFPAHSPSAPIPLTFCPQPALFPSPAHSPLSVTHRTCSSVTLSSTTSNIFPCPLVLLSTCHIPLSLLAYNLFTRLPVNSSTCPLLIELVHLLPCLLQQVTCSPVPPFPCLLTLSTPSITPLFCPYM